MKMADAAGEQEEPAGKLAADQMLKETDEDLVEEEVPQEACCREKAASVLLDQNRQ